MPNWEAPADPTDGIVQMEASLDRDGGGTFEAQWVLEALRIGVAAWEAAPGTSLPELATRHVKIDCVREWCEELANEIRLTKTRRNEAHRARAKEERKRAR